MKCLILAAGRGTRLGELTKNQPKPTIEVGKKTILQRIVENLHSHGIYQIIINCHYLPLIIEEKIGSNTLYFYEEVLLGHEGTISALKNWLEGDDFFVLNGDTISNVNFTEMATQHKEGTISVLMENWRCGGTWLYSQQYFTNRDVPILPYRPAGLIWFDIGTPERLKQAKDYFA